MRRLLGLAVWICCAIPGLSWSDSTLLDLDAMSLAELQALEQNAQQPALARVHAMIARRLIHSQPDQAVQYVNLAKQHAAPADTQLQSFLQANEAILALLAGDVEQAKALAENARNLADGVGYAGLKANSTSAEICYEIGEVDESMTFAAQAVGMAQQLGVAKIESEQHNNLGILYRSQARYEESLASFRQAIELTEDLPDDRLRNMIWFNMGLTYADLGEYETARDFFQNMLVQSQESGEFRRELTALIYLSDVNISLGRAAEAEGALLAALDREELASNQGYLAFAYATLGRAQLALEKVDEALFAYETGLKIAANEPNTYEQKRLYLGYPEALARAGRFDEALERLNVTTAQLRQTGPERDLKLALERMTRIYQEAGDAANALATYDELAELTRTIERTALERELADLRTVYELDLVNHELMSRERDLILRNGAIILLLALILIGYLFISRRNVMNERQLQAQVAHRLELEVEERTREIQAQMRAAEAAQVIRQELESQLAEADKLRVLGQLTGGVAHDFNNLLTIVSGAAELLRMGVDHAREEELIDHILDAAHSGADITRSLMAYARKQPLRMEAVDIGDFLQRNLPLVKRTLGAHLSLEVTIDSADGVMATLDAAQLTTALLNLVLNARDAQPSGRMQLYTELGADMIAICLQDQGMGMNESVMTKAIEPFYTTKPESQGQGLGLSMVYGFLKQIGGDLEFESVEGQGTLVRMLIPITAHSSQGQTVHEAQSEDVTLERVRAG